MARTTFALQAAAHASVVAALTSQLHAANATIATLRTQIEDVTSVASVVNRMAAPAAQPRPAAPTPLPRGAVVSCYTDRFGRTFEKTRIGNMATTREITVAHAAHAAQAVEDALV